MTLLFAFMVYNRRIYEGWLALGLVFDLLLVAGIVDIMK